MRSILSQAWLAMATLIAIFAVPAWAEGQRPLTVMTSIKPLQLITSELTNGVTKTEVLLSTNTSPHDYALKPSDVKKLKTVDLFVWVGPGLESFLEGVMQGSKNSLQLDQQSSIEKIQYDEHEEHEHDDGHHHHGNYNPHLWLGPIQATQMAKVISDKLIAIDPVHTKEYQANFQVFILNLNTTVDSIKHQLEPVKSHGYYVFHDAYDYYEQYFGLNNLGHFTVSPERRPGAKTLINIRTALQSDNVYCVFSEPQFTPAVIDSVMRGTKAKHGVLDPLASKYNVEPGAYFQFIQDLANSYSECLTR
ncbi:zinc ABC transporter substrate-binding protein ZnuA [Vibrio casei]|uniref:High-affinity zinc uptake system protein ZnuA n=2 Tax=Vibrio TaxID=662 RepID=A0A368LM48_9VIBR|nr:zinc ABC transporter substrate-binding protein ZnuA [Vibrio casei]SJN38687.1 Zinc ABC transporter, periplasmic-binding protein ZnuA [Vibrio casei]HBV75260.1 zinc ABC transporter substrate-binding protein ZnuA [Vibrio sp.]